MWLCLHFEELESIFCRGCTVLFTISHAQGPRVSTSSPALTCCPSFWLCASYWAWGGVSLWLCSHFPNAQWCQASLSSCACWSSVCPHWRNVCSDGPMFESGHLSLQLGFWESLSRYVIGKYFLLSCGLSFHFLDSFLWSIKAFHFYEVQIIYFFFGGSCFQCYMEEIMIWSKGHEDRCLSSSNDFKLLLLHVGLWSILSSLL